jgi:hypothetical protein
MTRPTDQRRDTVPIPVVLPSRSAHPIPKRRVDEREKVVGERQHGDRHGQQDRADDQIHTADRASAATGHEERVAGTAEPVNGLSI